MPMSAALSSRTRAHDGPALAARFAAVRAESCRIAAAVSAEDCAAQSMPDASPLKWHLAHTSWFFERFLLREQVADYPVFDPHYEYLFNSYYDSVGPRHARAERGLLTRPPLAEVLRYRSHVDAWTLRLLDTLEPGTAAADLVELGINHEQQHQELMFTDIKHLLSRNPLEPAYRTDLAAVPAARSSLRWIGVQGGLSEIGAEPAAGFCFDNELPRHRVWLEPFQLASRAVTNGEYREFVLANGYGEPRHWLADGWASVQQEGWSRPLYWSEELDSEFTLGGRRALDPAAPVCHVSYYEAEAFARWAGARLPTEAEWECVAATMPRAGNFADSDLLHPAPAQDDQLQLFGDVWEWTASAYSAYPGFRAAAGAVGEYNGKFMCNQLVLRGGSCATPAGHARATYRNFFYPQSRWQFMGLRLAKDGPR